MVLVAVTWSVRTLAPRFACVAILSYIHTFWRLLRLPDPCVGRHTSCSSCALLFVVYVFVGGRGALYGGVWFPHFGYVRMSLIPCFFPCRRPRL